MGLLIESSVHAMDTAFLVPVLNFVGYYIVNTFSHSEFGPSNEMGDSKYTALSSK